ncbi:MAG: CPXCG motif-containing cysteine-rich protein [Pseudomonadota bacterium]
MLERSVHCPYCGEPVDLTIDTSVDEQCYIEDCYVCCRPTEVIVMRVGADEWHVDVRQSD